ncbi:MAG: hypothetical protein Q8O67_11445 [Deltaproteobacteria bacterium]|nr:hypothetical protein [Deltaproteobacteria bacterium]
MILSLRLLIVVLLGSAALPVLADEPAPDAPVTTPPTTTTADEAPVSEVADTEPPVVIDLSIAADNPRSAPIVTTMLSDNVGVAGAIVHWRLAGAPGEPVSPWREAVLVGGSGPLRIARLPDGPQRTGFMLWIEAKDAAGNVARVASEHAPLTVQAATEGNQVRVEREAADDDDGKGPDPGWVMLAMATGIGASAGAGIFAYDLSVISQRTEQVDGLLRDDISTARRTELEGVQDELRTVFIQDAAAAATLGAIGAAALVTGVTLLVFAAVEQ